MFFLASLNPECFPCFYILSNSFSSLRTQIVDMRFDRGRVDFNILWSFFIIIRICNMFLSVLFDFFLRD